jgi:putative glutamine amidotransferase
MQKRPVIGITSAYEYEKERIYIKSNYYDAILISNGLPIIFPITEKEDCISEYVDLCDGFLFTGGLDLDASYYGEDNQQYMGRICPKRDYMEMKLIKQAIDSKKPLLGICRGFQLLNVAMGGSLFQDIYEQSTSNNLIQHQQQAPRWYPSHKVSIEKPSHMYNIFGEESVSVNTFHHQAVKKLAKGFRATAFAPDGIIEAIELKDANFVAGVQWHPEDMWSKYEKFKNLFKYLVEKCL